MQVLYEIFGSITNYPEILEASRRSPVQNSFFAYAKNLGKTQDFATQNQKAGESPVGPIYFCSHGVARTGGESFSGKSFGPLAAETRVQRKQRTLFLKVPMGAFFYSTANFLNKPLFIFNYESKRP